MIIDNFMKILVVQFKHETNTFSPWQTTWESFNDGKGLSSGEQAIAEAIGTNQCHAAFLDCAKQIHAMVEVPIAGRASPSGPLTQDTFEKVINIAAARTRLFQPDVALLDLHGAMIADGHIDADAEMVECVRAAAPKSVIGVALDLHANLSKRLVDAADVVAGYKTYPHVDMYDIGRRVAELSIESALHKIPIFKAYINVPLIAHTARMSTERGPMAALVHIAMKAESRGSKICSVFGGFYSADTPNNRLAAVTCARESQAIANGDARDIAAVAWLLREEFSYRPRPLEIAVSDARATMPRCGPVILLDQSDNATSGSTQDVMDVVKECLRQGLNDFAAGPIRDPQTVALALAAGVGARVRFLVGGKESAPAIGLTPEPLEIEAEVVAIADGAFYINGPVLTGMRMDIGKAVHLKAGLSSFLVCERSAEPFDLNPFLLVGIDPRKQNYLILKSKMHFRAAYEPISSAIIHCDGRGVGTTDMAALRYSRVPRPVYPFDQEMTNTISE